MDDLIGAIDPAGANGQLAAVLQVGVQVGVLQPIGLRVAAGPRAAGRLTAVNEAESQVVAHQVVLQVGPLVGLQVGLQVALMGVPVVAPMAAPAANPAADPVVRTVRLGEISSVRCGVADCPLEPELIR